ncbi:hypothetical protein [Halobaculum sp. MBLA0143]|uniref:hypothetical protein n=1 Tax=Halobaculum sp. MBLA0143 TaxID=3079933 RepID=UPI0035236927
MTGDGQAESRRLAAVAPKYDDDQVLFCPSSNGGEIEQGALRIVGSKKRGTDPGGATGTKVIDGLRGRLKHYDDVVFVVDAEHFRENPKTELTTKFRDLNWNVETTTTLGDGAYEFSLSVGSTRVTVYAAVVGDRFDCFEDGIAALLQRRRDISQRSLYDGVDDRDDLKQRIDGILDCSDDKLVREANRHEIGECLPALAAVLCQFE